MTESTQLQTADNNTTGVTKMEPPPPLPSTSPAPSTAIDHLQHHQQQYALKWNDFQTSILNSFRHLRDEEDFIDVTLACDKRSFTAHKVVLSACSPYFRKLLKANPCEHPIVILRDVHAEDVENLLSFMYNGEVNVSHEQLPDFLKTAHLLQIRGLADVNGAGSGIFNSKQHHNNNNSNSNNNNNNSISNSNNNNNHNNGNKFNFMSALVSSSNASHNNNNGNNNSNHSSSGNNCSSSNNKTSTNNNSTSNSNNSTTNNNCSITPFPAPTSLMSTTIAAAAAVAAGAANLAAVTNSISSHNTSNSNNTNTTNTSMNSNALISGNTPAIQELKASSASPVNHHWDLAEGDPSSRVSHLTPPPQKRIKSADLFRAQHGISPERLLIDREFPVAGQHPLTRERNRDRDRSRETSRDRDRNLELRESLLGQALENSNGQQMNNMQKPHGDLNSLHAQSAGEDSNSSDTEPSDRGDGQQDDSMNGSLDNQRSHSFPSAFLGLQGIPGLLPGPSGIGANDFDA